MNHRYFFVQVASKMGMAASFVRTKYHPLHPVEELAIQKKMARLTEKKVIEQTGDLGFKLDHTLFAIMNAIELEREVASARWPEDFGIKVEEKEPEKGLIVPP